MGILLNKSFNDYKEMAEKIANIYKSKTYGHPEAQIRQPLEDFLRMFGEEIEQHINVIKDSPVEDIGIPDFAIEVNDNLIGYIEVKDTNKDILRPELFVGHDKKQFEKYKQLPNLLYTNTNKWALYCYGTLKNSICINGDIKCSGKQAIEEDDFKQIYNLLTSFTKEPPIVPKKPKELAECLAKYCQILQEDILICIKKNNPVILSLKEELKKSLLPDCTDEIFANNFAQTVLFALLLARIESNEKLKSILSAVEILQNHYSLLSHVLYMLVNKVVEQELVFSLQLVRIIINEIDLSMFNYMDETDNPWLFFYEHFLAYYDPKLRKQAGVYYTPIEVVNCQIRLTEEILSKQFNLKDGFANQSVKVLDPAMGTGTYLLAIVTHTISHVIGAHGHGYSAIQGALTNLSKNLHGFEWMIAPYAVAQIRLSKIFRTHKVDIPVNGLNLHLTNTLEMPILDSLFEENPTIDQLNKLPCHNALYRENKQSTFIKNYEDILVCIGNPPYGRKEASNEIGSWMTDENFSFPILLAFIKNLNKSQGVHVKNLYNLYVFFIRWAFWKVFEHPAINPDRAGIVSFITASSYLTGPGFAGMREYMRRICDQIDIIDLGGEGRGTHKEENVFDIQLPVAIFIAYKSSESKMAQPAIVRYTKVSGTREEKLKKLNIIQSGHDLQWEDVSKEWQDAFIPIQDSLFFKWPSIIKIFSQQFNGIKAGRTWVISYSRETINKRLNKLFSSEKKEFLFKNSPTGKKANSIANIIEQKKLIIEQYSYRSFDKQFIVLDERFLDRQGKYCQIHSDNQIYLASLFSNPLGCGPGLTVCENIPDLHYFKGSYGSKTIIPMYIDTQCQIPNCDSTILKKLNCSIQDLFSYTYSLLAHPEYTQTFQKELLNCEVRIPITKNKNLFNQAITIGRYLIWLHTHGERFYDSSHPKNEIPIGMAKSVDPISIDQYPDSFKYDSKTQSITVGDGSFAPVSQDIWDFEISGFKVVKSWLGYRMKNRKGKKSSPLDDIIPDFWTYEMTCDFLELLWTLEKTIEIYPKQKVLFEEILNSELYLESDFSFSNTDPKRSHISNDNQVELFDN